MFYSQRRFFSVIMLKNNIQFNNSWDQVCAVLSPKKDPLPQIYVINLSSIIFGQETFCGIIFQMENI